MNDEPLFKLALKAIALIEPGSEAAPLLQHFDNLLPQVKEIAQNKFFVWMGVLNVVMQWYMAGHPAFDNIRESITPGEPMQTLPACLEPDLWPRPVPKETSPTHCANT